MSEINNARGILQAIQLIASKHETGQLEITSSQNHGALNFSKGKLVDATLGTLSGFQAVNAAVSLREVQFGFHSLSSVPRPGSILPNERIVLQRFFGIEAADATADEVDAVDWNLTPHQVVPLAEVEAEAGAGVGEEILGEFDKGFVAREVIPQTIRSNSAPESLMAAQIGRLSMRRSIAVSLMVILISAVAAVALILKLKPSSEMAVVSPQTSESAGQNSVAPAQTSDSALETSIAPAQTSATNQTTVAQAQTSVSPDQTSFPPAQSSVSPEQPSTHTSASRPLTVPDVKSSKPDTDEGSQSARNSPAEQPSRGSNTSASSASLAVATTKTGQRDAKSQNVNGEWHLINTINKSAYKSFKNMQIGFRLKIEQKGSGFTARGEKISENGRMLPARSRTPIIVTGSIEGDKVVATFVEDGLMRRTNGRFEWKLEDAQDELTGTFSSAAANSSGKSAAKRQW